MKVKIHHTSSGYTSLDKYQVEEDPTRKAYEDLANAIIYSYIEDFYRIPGMLKNKDPRVQMEGQQIIEEIKSERFLKHPILDYYDIDIKSILRKEVHIC